MAIAHEFDYLKPPTLREAVKVLARYGTRARALAGGTDLVGLISDGMIEPEAVVDIKGIPGLDRIEFKGGLLSIGALVTFSDLRESAVIARKFPVIREMTGWVASVGIRNRATMVGNLCSAVPCCDSGPVLLVYDAAVLVAGANGRRKVPLREWFVGPRKTVLKRGELATGVVVSLPKQKHGACFVKLRRYEGEDLAQASVTVLALAGNRYRIAFGSVAPRPIRGGENRGAAGRAGAVRGLDSGSRAARAGGDRAHHRHPGNQGIPRAHDRRDARTRPARCRRAARRRRDRNTGPA